MEKIKVINKKVEEVFEILDELSYEGKLAVIDIAQRMLQINFDPYQVSPK